MLSFKWKQLSIKERNQWGEYAAAAGSGAQAALVPAEAIGQLVIAQPQQYSCLVQVYPKGRQPWHGDIRALSAQALNKVLYCLSTSLPISEYRLVAGT